MHLQCGESNWHFCVHKKHVHWSNKNPHAHTAEHSRSQTWRYILLVNRTLQSISIENITPPIRNNQSGSHSVLCWIIWINCDFHPDFVRITQTMCVVSHRTTLRQEKSDDNDDDATGINFAWDEPNGRRRRNGLRLRGVLRKSCDSTTVIVVGSESYTTFKVILTLSVCVDLVHPSIGRRCHLPSDVVPVTNWYEKKVPGSFCVWDQIELNDIPLLN